MTTGSDWYRDVCTRANLLVVGPADATEVFLNTIQPHLQEPVVFLRGGEPLALPPRAVGTLILTNAWALTPAEQHQLHESLNGRFTATQVISISAICLMPMVAAGSFHGPLYYRLNTIYIDATARPSTL